MDKNPQSDPARDPRGLRRGHPYNELLPGTLHWVQSLPVEVRPLALTRQFPRIANALARSWKDSAECHRRMEELLVDRRGNRRGFPLDVLKDLLALRDYCQGRYPHLPPLSATRTPDR